MKRILGLSLLFLCTLVSKADAWICAYEDNELYVFFYDEIKRTKDGYKVWLEWEYKKPQKLETKYYSSIKSYEEYNFDFDQQKIYTNVFYDKQGKVIDSYETNYPSWSYLIPGSIGYYVAKEICEFVNPE